MKLGKMEKICTSKDEDDDDDISLQRVMMVASETSQVGIVSSCYQ